MNYTHRSSPWASKYSIRPLRKGWEATVSESAITAQCRCRRRVCVRVFVCWVGKAEEEEG